MQITTMANNTMPHACIRSDPGACFGLVKAAGHDEGHDDGQDGEGVAQGAGATIATWPLVHIRAAIRRWNRRTVQSRDLTDTIGATTDTDRGMGADMDMGVGMAKDSAEVDRQHDLVAPHGAHSTVADGVVLVVQVQVQMGHWKTYNVSFLIEPWLDQ